MKIRCNALLLGGIVLLVITSITLGLFIGLLDPVEIENEPINETLYAAESTSMYSQVLKKLKNKSNKKTHGIAIVTCRLVFP